MIEEYQRYYCDWSSPSKGKSKSNKITAKAAWEEDNREYKPYRLWISM